MPTMVILRNKDTKSLIRKQSHAVNNTKEAELGMSAHRHLITKLFKHLGGKMAGSADHSESSWATDDSHSLASIDEHSLLHSTISSPVEDDDSFEPETRFFHDDTYKIIDGVQWKRAKDETGRDHLYAQLRIVPSSTIILTRHAPQSKARHRRPTAQSRQSSFRRVAHSSLSSLQHDYQYDDPEKYNYNESQPESLNQRSRHGGGGHQHRAHPRQTRRASCGY